MHPLLRARPLPSSTVFSASRLLGIVEHARVITNPAPIPRQAPPNDSPLSPEALCINKSEELDRYAANFMAKPAHSAEDTNINSCSVLRPHPVLTASSHAAANANEPRNSMKIWAVFFGCSPLHPSGITIHPTPTMHREGPWPARKRLSVNHHNKNPMRYECF